MKEEGKKTFSSNRIKILMEYFKTYGTLKNIKQRDVFELYGTQINIGNIINELRREKKLGILKNDLIELLDYMEIKWEGKSLFEEKKVVLLAWYYKHHTLSNIKQATQFDYNGTIVDIGEIVNRLRIDKKKGELTDAQIQFLEMCGFVWEPKGFENIYAVFVAYKEEFGSIADIMYSDTYTYGGKVYGVGRQLQYVRKKYNAGLLSQNEIEFFENLGIVWGKTRKQKELADE